MSQELAGSVTRTPEGWVWRGACPWRSLALALVVLGTLQFGHGAWIQAKAWLAHALIAQAWSRTLMGGAPVRPWPWADAWPVARLRAPALGIERYVLAGAHGSTLAFGPGHVDGTPVPGDVGNSVVGGHRDTHLAFLRALKAGDLIEVQRSDGRIVPYRVVEGLVLDKRDVWVAKQEGPTRLTLVTCFPFDVLRAGGRQRYVVFALELENRGGERGMRG